MEKHLRQLLLDSARSSYVEIAGIMTQRWGMPLTNNSIAGKINRMRLSGVRIVHNFKSRKKLRLPPEPPEPEPASEPSIPTLFDLRPTSCRWPVGWNDSSEYLFCGALKDPMVPYCDEHARRAFVKARPK